MMGRVKIETTGPYHEIFAVRSFQDQQTIRCQCAPCLVEQELQVIKVEVLNDMKRRNQLIATIRRGLQGAQRILIAGVEPDFVTGGQHCVIEVDALSVKTHLAKHL